jgi:adenosine deaminase
VNTDNRLITNTTVSKELWLAHSCLGIPFSDNKAIILGGFKSSFRPFHERQAAVRKVLAEMDRYDENGIPKSSPGDETLLSPRARSSAKLPE